MKREGVVRRSEKALAANSAKRVTRSSKMLQPGSSTIPVQPARHNKRTIAAKRIAKRALLNEALPEVLPKDKLPSSAFSSLSCSGNDGDSNVSGVDRISDFPEALISTILSLLPTTSAVATGFLSKNWRLRWTKISSFDFDSELWRTQRLKCQECRENVSWMHFLEFVNTVLIQSTAENFDKFRLRWNPPSQRSVYFTTWVRTAITRNIRVLELETISRPCRYDDHNRDGFHVHHNFHLPVALYTCGTLEVLKLRGIINLKVPDFVFLPKLSVLELNDVKYASSYRSIHRLVAGCPVLQSLVIVRYHYDDNCKTERYPRVVVVISSPTLKRLEIYNWATDCDCAWDTFNLVLEIDTLVLEYLVLDDNKSSSILVKSELSSVTEAKLDICHGTPVGPVLSTESYGKMAARLFKACDRVTDMKVGVSSLWSISSAPYELSFKRLIKLDIEIQPYYLSCAIGFIGCCDKLEVLAVNISKGWGSVEATEQRVPKCFGSSLRQVLVSPFHGAKFELDVVKFILHHGLLLERVDLHHRSDYHRREKSPVLKEVLKFSRASLACIISYSEMK